MSLLKEFEENVDEVVKIFESISKVIEQQLIYKDLSINQIGDITVVTSLGMSLKEKALNDVSVAMYFGSALWKNSFHEILMWLNRNIPQYKSQIERQYSKIVNDLNALLSAQHDWQGIGLEGLQGEIERLVNDLHYCKKMAKEELATEKPAEEAETKAICRTEVMRTPSKVAGLVKDKEKRKKFQQRLMEATQLDDKRAEALYESIIRALEDTKLLNSKIKPEGEKWEWDDVQGTILDEFIDRRLIPKNVKGDDDKSRKYRQQIGEQIRKRLSEGFWRKPLPFSPSIWADYYFTDSFFVFYGPAPKPEPKDDYEKLLSEYYFFGHTYDTILDPPAIDRLQDISEDRHEYNVNLYNLPRDTIGNDHKSGQYWEGLKARIDTALVDVKADLVKRAAAGHGGKKKNWTVALANEAILPIIKKYGKTPLKLTARFLEAETGCPHSTVANTDNWECLKGIKRIYRKQQGKMQRKPVNLSDGMLNIAEQNKDGSIKLHTSHKKKNIEEDS
ncbi:MAG: hypothetical protein GY845_35885 [Planctomycetes bacterium]|nr:hypothetical protein [Planctomycetota bacterium]